MAAVQSAGRNSFRQSRIHQDINRTTPPEFHFPTQVAKIKILRDLENGLVFLAVKQPSLSKRPFDA